MTGEWASRRGGAGGAYWDMAIPHAGSGEPIDVHPLGARLHETKTVALFKSDELEVLHLVLPAGKGMPPHKVPGEITIQCIEGALDVTVNGVSQVLRAGQLMFLNGHVVHGVLAIEDASALVTIVLHCAGSGK